MELNQITQDLLCLHLNVPEDCQLEIIQSNDGEKIELLLREDELTYLGLTFLKEEIFLENYFMLGSGIDEKEDRKNMVTKIMKSANARITYREHQGDILINEGNFRLEMSYGSVLEVLKDEFGVNKDEELKIVLT